VEYANVRYESARRFWSELAGGRYRYVSSVSTGERCFGALAPREPADERRFRLSPRGLAILERLLRGERQKAIAIDLKISDAAVANTLAQCRRRLGLSCRSAELPTALVLLAQAAGSDRVVAVHSHPNERDTRFSFPRPDASLVPALTHAEAQVVTALIDGLSQREIAEARNARWRTVVNQLATARRKLPVSSRVELVRFLSALREPERTSLSA
jgi:DNA-binding NarL/FixJ family response regulator